MRLIQSQNYITHKNNQFTNRNTKDALIQGKAPRKKGQITMPHSYQKLPLLLVFNENDKVMCLKLFPLAILK